MRATRASLLARAGSAAAVAVLASGGLIATATAAGAATHHHPHALARTTLSIRNKLIAHGHHKAEAVTGVLRSSHRKGVAGETITLDSRTPHHKWAVAGTGMTGTDGSVTITVTAPTRTTQYQLVFAGGKATGYRGSHSNVITVKAVKAVKG